jgi:hypothetical protein
MSIRYQFPLSILPALALDVITHRRRSFKADADDCIRRLQPPLRVLGEENIPVLGPCVVTVNHYHRPGFSAEWLALAISASLPLEMHWIMTGEWTAPGKWYQPLKGFYSRRLLKMLSNVYGFTTMPPMPPRKGDVGERARSVRKVLSLMRANGDTILGLAPEGTDQIGGRLSLPPPGVGRFGLLLAGLGSSFVPVGAYEKKGVFCLHFGSSYRLIISSGLSTEEKGASAAKIIMERIAPLLPESLRGEFK